MELLLDLLAHFRPFSHSDVNQMLTVGVNSTVNTTASF